ETDHDINDMIYGIYQYEITPRYMINDLLQPADATLAVSFPFEVSPYESGELQIGFTRGFIESQAYTRHFGSNNKIRPNKTDLIFDITSKSGPLEKDKKQNKFLKDYSFELQHTWLGWQARLRIIEMFHETLMNTKMSMDVFAFDLDEPVICQSLIQLGKEGRARVILDNSSEHVGTGCFEQDFEKLYKQKAPDSTIARGKFGALAHSKVFIQKLNGVPVKVLTGSTNFSTNGLYINANHVIIFNNKNVAALYEKVFEDSFGQTLMNAFDSTVEATTDNVFSETILPPMTIRFSPHTKAVAQTFFNLINSRILGAKTDVLFAIMKDNSKSSILDAVQQQVKSDKVFTYGITDQIGDKTQIMLYKPESKKGIRVAGRPGQFILPPPFEKESNIPGISVHHKFVVVDFKGPDPVVYCGSSNLAFNPEQNNGDNLIEIRDKDAVTVFAIEAIRLVDHFEFRNAEFMAQQKKKASDEKAKAGIHLHSTKEKDWVKKYYDPKDLKTLERTLLIG
ncbi:MAG TPA: phospholipase D-like domain-containing protein, partial [Chitinophagaceae bacterium]|nr:phospholipase D-like domain-containing protein [Chitinophagaceae bacterium]